MILKYDGREVLLSYPVYLTTLLIVPNTRSRHKSLVVLMLEAVPTPQIYDIVVAKFWEKHVLDVD
jgi:hypothetical protein